VWVAIVLLCLPEAIIAYRSGAGWLGWLKQPSVNDLWSVLIALAGGSWLMLIALLACGFYATMCAVREKRYWPSGFVAAWLFAPIAMSFAVSFVQPMFLARYLTICVPALALFGASAIPQLRRSVAIGVLVALFVGLSAMQLADYYSQCDSEDWRDATRSVRGDTRPGDAIIFYPSYAREPFEYYQRQAEAVEPTLVSDSRPIDEPRIWLMIRESDVPGHSLAMRQLQSSLMEKYRSAVGRKFSGVEVELYVRKIQ
jgi:mannosyltransferase